MKKVLFLGASGRVGETASDYLLRNLPDVELTLVTRSSEVDIGRYGKYSDRVKTMHADITDVNLLKEMITENDLVISCVGPSHRIGSLVIDACAEKGAALLDVSGYDPALKHLDSLNADGVLRAPIVVNSGLLPGLSGSYPQYLIHRYRDYSPVEKVEVFYAGRDVWSLSSAIDIVSSLGGFGDNKGFCRIENGELRKLGFLRSMVSVKFPEPVGRVSGMSMYSEEMARLIRDENIKTACVSEANIGKRAGFSLLLSMIFRRYASEKGIVKGAESLVKASVKDRESTSPFYGISCRLTLADGRIVNGMLTAADTYTPTGYVVGINAVSMLTGELAPRGYSMHEAVPAEYLIPALQKSGVLTLITDSFAD